jgi:hypothetical protein
MQPQFDKGNMKKIKIFIAGEAVNFYSASDAAKKLGEEIVAFRKKTKRGAVPSVTLGRSVFVPCSFVDYISIDRLPKYAVAFLKKALKNSEVFEAIKLVAADAEKWQLLAKKERISGRKRWRIYAVPCGMDAGIKDYSYLMTSDGKLYQYAI